MSIQNEIETINNNAEKFTGLKNKLKEFIQNLPDEIKIKDVQTGGSYLGVTNHNVTGTELNEITEITNENFINNKNALNRIMQEFNTIYETFDSLDKNYLQRIVAALKSAEEADRKARKGLDEIKVHQVDIKSNQIEIKKIIEKQEDVIHKQELGIQVLTKFKAEIEKVKHLTDIDAIFEINSEIQDNLNTIKSTVALTLKAHSQTIDKFSDLVNSSHLNFKNELKDQKESNNKQFIQVNQLISEQQEHFFKTEEKNKEDRITLENELKDQKKNTNNQFIEVNQLISEQMEHLVKTEEKNKNCQIKIEDINEKIAEIDQYTDQLSKKLKMNQIISITSIFISCILVALIISGVLK